MEWSPVHPEVGHDEWIMQWICRSCGRNITLSDVPSLQPGQCVACSSPLGLVVDAHSGHATRCCTSCPRAAVLCAEQPVGDVPSWFSSGPLSGFGALFGWGSGPLTVPGSGTQSWMFCSLISLGLERAEVLRAVVPFSVGGRAQSPPDQAQFWHRNVLHVIEAWTEHFMGFSSSDPRAVALTSRESWGVGGDHLSPQLQESMVPGEVLSMMTVWLTAQVSQFQRDSQVPDSPTHTDSPFNQPDVSVVPPAQGRSPFNDVQPTSGAVSESVVVSHLFAHVVSPTDLPRPAQSTSLTVTAAPEVVAGAGPRRLTRFLEMPRDPVYSTLRGLINAGRFNHIGHPNVRLEGQTAWGVWLRVDLGEELTAPGLALGVVSSTMSPIESWHSMEVQSM